MGEHHLERELDSVIDTRADFKKDDVLKCIKSFSPVAFLTVGNTYKVLWTTPKWMYLADNTDRTVALPNERGQFVLSENLANKSNGETASI